MPAARCAGSSAIASAELDHDSPSARKASTAACWSSTGGASTTISPAARSESAKPCFVARTSARDRSSARRRPISTRNRARWDSSACLARKARARSVALGTSSGQASPSARASAKSTGRVASETTRFSFRTTLRQASTTSAPEESSVSTSSMRRDRSPPLPIRRATGASSTSDALSTSAVSAGMSASRAARSARASDIRAAFACRRRMAMPAMTSSRAARVAGGSGMPESSSASARSASSRRPMRSRRRASRLRACAALTWSPCASRVDLAASSVFVGQPRSRETRAISASATMQRARATACLWPKACAALLRRVFARPKSPSCAIAMPRSASAWASSRKATRFSTPRRSPAASARAAAVISESIEIPSHLSLSPFDLRL